MDEKFAVVNIRETKEKKIVKITSEDKPEILDELINKWQSLIDLVAEIINVPSALIMRLNETNIEVFLKSNTSGNPYEKNEKAELIYGLYCETVIGTKKKLLVPDARESVIWKDNNPDINLNMVSYLGFPILWPDGEVFGTVCVLDNKKNSYNDTFERLLYNIKLHIESDLNQLLLKKEIEEKNDELNKYVNLKTKFLSLISHDVRGSISTIDEYLKMLITKVDEYEKERIKNIIMTISKNISALYVTLQNLLEWTKKDLFELETNKTEINIVELVNKVIDFFRFTLDYKEIKLQLEFDSSEIMIYADEKMMETVLRNVISNAIKFNKQNGEILIKVQKKENKTNIIIRDSGDGIDKDTLNKIFKYDEHYRPKMKLGKGISIGLLLTREFVLKNDGQIEIESELGKWTEVRIVI